ncbi:hypothetical protein QOT17_021242 [Balamuthia mandrillaris]
MEDEFDALIASLDSNPTPAAPAKQHQTTTADAPTGARAPSVSFKTTPPKRKDEDLDSLEDLISQLETSDGPSSQKTTSDILSAAPPKKSGVAEASRRDRARRKKANEDLDDLLNVIKPDDWTDSSSSSSSVSSFPSSSVPPKKKEEQQQAAAQPPPLVKREAIDSRPPPSPEDLEQLFLSLDSSSKRPAYQPPSSSPSSAYTYSPSIPPPSPSVPSYSSPSPYSSSSSLPSYNSASSYSQSQQRSPVSYSSPSGGVMSPSEVESMFKELEGLEGRRNAPSYPSSYAQQQPRYPAPSYPSLSPAYSAPPPARTPSVGSGGVAESPLNDYNLCCQCHLPLTTGEKIKALGHYWHLQCWRCTRCGVLFMEQKAFLKGGQPFCGNCSRF